MKIGIFDSGLGGLIIARAVMKRLPEYDYVYFGDTKNLPYGQKSPTQIRRQTQKAVGFLFRQDCALIILACNTASAWALRKIQQEHLPTYYPDRKVLGVIVPTLETADQRHRRKTIGVLGTAATINSHIYKKELLKINPAAKISEIPAPKLVPLIERGALQEARKYLELYLQPLKKQGVEAWVLACTHYPILKKDARKIAGKKAAIISQDEIIPAKLAGYLSKHPEIESRLSKKRKRSYWITAQRKNFGALTKRLLGKRPRLRLAKY